MRPDNEEVDIELRQQCRRLAEGMLRLERWAADAAERGYFYRVAELHTERERVVAHRSQLLRELWETKKPSPGASRTAEAAQRGLEHEPGQPQQAHAEDEAGQHVGGAGLAEGGAQRLEPGEPRDEQDWQSDEREQEGHPAGGV